MNTLPITGHSLAGKSVSLTARAALIACAALALAVPALRADTAGQTKIEAEIQTIQPGKTIVSCSASTLATAVFDAIKTGTSTPTDFAISALQPYPLGQVGAAVRADRNTTAGLVASQAVAALISKGDTTFPADVGSIVDSLCVVNGTNASENLASTGTTGMSLVAKDAVGTLSNAYVVATGTSKVSGTTLLVADTVIGQKLFADTALENLAGTSLVTIAANAMAGITGTNGLAVSVAPAAAAKLALGLVSTGTNPDRAHGEAFTQFTVSLLANVVANTSVDEFAVNAIAAKDNNTTTAVHQAALVALGEALFTGYPGRPLFNSKVVQGMADSIPQGNSLTGEPNRIAFANALTTGTVAQAITILQGMIYADPFYAAGTAAKSGFTYGIFATVASVSGTTGLVNISAAAATAIGNVLGQDGSVLTEVAGTYSSYIAAGKLGIGAAATYATDLLTGAQTSTVPTTQFTGVAAGAGGGKLYLGSTSTSNNMTTLVVKDLASIATLLSEGIVQRLGVTGINASPSTAATDIGAIIAAVTKFTTNEVFTDTQNSVLSGSVGVFLAASLDDYIVSLGFNTTAQNTILNTITADAKIHVTNSTFQTELTNQQADAAAKHSNYVAITGALAGEETTCTNL